MKITHYTCAFRLGCLPYLQKEFLFCHRHLVVEFTPKGKARLLAAIQTYKNKQYQL